MTDETFVKRAPDYKGDGVAVWVKQTREGKPYLSIKLLGSVNVAAFKNEPKEQTDKEKTTEVSMADLA